MTIAQLFLNLSNYIDVNSVNFSEGGINLFEGIHHLYNLDFNETGLQLKQLIEQTYKSGITGLEDVQVEGSNITGIFLDQVSPGITQKFQFTITPKNISYQRVSPGNGELTPAEYSEWVDFANVTKPKKLSNKELMGDAVTDKTGKTKYCTPNKTFGCGKRCIAVGKECNDPLNQQQQQLQKEVVAKATGQTEDKKKRGRPKKVAEPTTTATTTEAKKRGRPKKVVEPTQPTSDSNTTSSNKKDSIDNTRTSARIGKTTEAGDNMLGSGIEKKPRGRKPKVENPTTEQTQPTQPASTTRRGRPKKTQQTEQTATEVKKPTTAASKKSQERSPSPTPDSTDTTSAKKPESSQSKAIKSYDDFKDHLIDTWKMLDKTNGTYAGFVPIWHLKKELGNSVTSEQFKDWMMKMQGSGLLYLQTGGKKSEDALTDDQRKDSITNIVGDLLIYASKPLDGTSGIPEWNRSDSENTRQSKPAIKNYAGFESDAMDAFNKLDKSSYNNTGLVPIWHLRKEMGDKVSPDKFNDWLMEMQANGQVYLQSGEARGATEEQKRNSINSDVRGLLFFVSKSPTTEVKRTQPEQSAKTPTPTPTPTPATTTKPESQKKPRAKKSDTKPMPDFTTSSNSKPENKKMSRQGVLDLLDQGIKNFYDVEKEEMSRGRFQRTGTINRLEVINRWYKSGRNPDLSEVSGGMLNDLALDAKDHNYPGKSKYFSKAADVGISTYYNSLSDDQKNEIEKQIPERSYLSTEYLPEDSLTYKVAQDVEQRRKARKKREWDEADNW